MSHKFCIASCMLFLITCCSGVVFSQVSFDSDREFRRELFSELHKSEAEMRQFGESVRSLFDEIPQKVQAKVMPAIMERMRDTSTPMSPEEGMKLGLGIALDEMIEIQKPFNDKTAEFFTEEGRQTLHLRMFQVRMGFMDHLEATDNPEAVQAAFGLDMFQLMSGQPDFIDLSPEQRELLIKQQRETSLEALSLTTQATLKMVTTNPEKLAEIRRLADAMTKAETEEEREKIAKQLQRANMETMSEIAPEMKAILIRGHEDFMRVLTDAQKAKIKAVMADMPESLKKLLAEIDKGGSALSGLESWVPGMGVPGVNPNREAPRQRTGGGSRAFSE